MSKKKEMPNWVKLDNAATIYPSTLSRKYAAMFRMSVTLTEKIDEKLLNESLKNVIKRFPTFRYKLKQGMFWCYFKKIDGTPEVQDDYKNPLLRINFKENNSFMFRVRYFDKRISVEYFHALTDGTGGISFLLTLTGEYLRLKYGIDIKYTNQILNPKEKAKKDEYLDRFNKYARNIGGLEHEMPAYHQKGTIEDKHILNIITGTIPLDKLKARCKEYNCTVTEFIVSLMILSFQGIQEKEIKKQTKRKPIKISVPVNLRKLYKTNTMRNFSSYVNVGVYPKYGRYTFEEIIKEVKSNMALLLSEKRLNAKITGNVKLSNNYFIRLIPMFIKKYIMSTIERLMGDRYCSSTFSNIGLIDLPKEMSPYIKSMAVILGRSRGKPGASSAISCNGKMYISFSRKIKESEFERLFFTKLVELKIPVEIESNMGR